MKNEVTVKFSVTNEITPNELVEHLNNAIRNGIVDSLAVLHFEVTAVNLEVTFTPLKH